MATRRRIKALSARGRKASSLREAGIWHCLEDGKIYRVKRPWTSALEWQGEGIEIALGLLRIARLFLACIYLTTTLCAYRFAQTSEEKVYMMQSAGRVLRNNQ